MTSRVMLIPVLLATACTGAIGDTLGLGPDGSVQNKVCDAVSPAPLRRLSRSEYNLTVRDLLGDTSSPADIWQAAGTSTGFDNDAAGQTASDLEIQAMITSAEAVAADVASRLSSVVPCTTTACAHSFIDDFARRAYRRPVTSDETKALRDVYAKAGAFQDGIVAIVETVLSSPKFLYKVEEGQGAPHDGVVDLTPYELATRLAYFITGSTPDDDLFAAAAANALATPEQIEAEARRLLATPEARERVRTFFTQAFGLDRILDKQKDHEIFATFDDATRQDLRNGVLTFAEHVVFDAARPTLTELLTAPYAFVTKRTAPLYDTTSTSTTLQRTDLDPAHRAGFLTDSALMSILAEPEQSSPIARGVFVRVQLLCQNLGAPPDANIASVPVPDPKLTTRERFAAHTAEPVCAGCHKLIDPIGFGFEGFDAVGRYRDTENGKAIDTQGELTNTDITGPFKGVVELANLLVQSQEVSACVADRWIMFALGRNLGDECMRLTLEQRFASTGGDFVDLIIAIATDPSFRTRPALAAESCEP